MKKRTQKHIDSLAKSVLYQQQQLDDREKVIRQLVAAQRTIADRLDEVYKQLAKANELIANISSDKSVESTQPVFVAKPAAYPHCDSAVLHAPGECIYCDRYPDSQNQRIESHVNFTGHYDTDKSICPSELSRPLDTINKWGGNVPMTLERQAAIDKEWEAFRQHYREVK